MGPAETTAIITAVISGGVTITAAVISVTARYIFRMPAQQNGALRELVVAIKDLKSYNRREHEEFLQRFEELANILAPRIPIAGRRE